MNDLMTKSFQSYVELKRQAMKDMESETEQNDVEMGRLDPTDENNLSQFFNEVATIKSDMEDITNLNLDLQHLNEETKSTHSAKILRGLRDRINSDMVFLLRKAKTIKTKLELLDQSNVVNRSISPSFREGTPVDRTRVAVTNGLRLKLREMMNEFQSLRDGIVNEHREGLKRRYYNATGEMPSEEVVEKMMVSGGQIGNNSNNNSVVSEELVKENEERQEALKDLQRSLTKLHQVFLDMAVIVETQGEKMNEIEENVVTAGSYVGKGTKELIEAEKMKKSRKWILWVVILVMVFVMVCILALTN